MDNYVGKRLDGRYEIQEIIGVGGMSVVYKAYDNIDDRIVAVKILKDEFLANAEFRRRFKNESKAIAVLSHPNIVKVYDVSFGEKLQYIVMEYVDGITLKEYIQQQKVLDWREAVHFTTQILRALQHAHDKGIVHRDIKPQNIMILQNGNIKVADFGIARFSRSETRTITENAIGSVHYISPEQASGKITDEKADIYSVGVVLYEMVTGEVPFEADSAVSVAIMQVQSEPKRPTQLTQAIPLGLEQIILHAMRKSSAERYQTATEMLLDIDELNRNPNAVFDYSYFVDKQPTKFVSQVDDPANMQNYDPLEEPEPTEKDKEKIKKIITASCIGAVVLIAAIVGLVFAFGNSLGLKKYEVPRFIGMNYEEEIRNKYPDFTFADPIYKPDTEHAAGTVIAQDPAEKTKVSKKQKVTLTIATSGETAIVPSVSGLTVDAAIQSLNAQNILNINQTYETSDTVDNGLVIRTNPGEGESVSTSAQVTIVVSSGKEDTTTTVPRLVDMQYQDVKAFLEGRKLELGKVTTQESSKSKDTVISQSIQWDSSVPEGTKIDIVISSGPPATTAAPTTQPVTEAKKVSITFTLPNTNKEGQLTVYINNVKREKLSESVLMNGKTHTVTIKGETGQSDTVIISIDGVQQVEARVNFAQGHIFYQRSLTEEGQD